MPDNDGARKTAEGALIIALALTGRGLDTAHPSGRLTKGFLSRLDTDVAQSLRDHKWPNTVATELERLYYQFRDLCLQDLD